MNVSSPTKDDPLRGKFVLGFMTGLMAVCYGLDAFDFWGRTSASDVTARLACFLEPYTWFVGKMMPGSLLDYGAGQCKGIPNETAISIIFFMLKITLGLITPLLLPVYIFASKKHYLREDYERSVFRNKKNGKTMWDVTRQSAVFVLCMLALAVSAISTVAQTGDPSKFQISLGSKILFENNAVLFTYMGGMIVVLHLIRMLAYVTYQPKNQKGA